jgi:hypothetical protein
MRHTLIIILALLTITSSQVALSRYKTQFLTEIESFRPKFLDKNTEKLVTKVAKTYTVESSYTNKEVDLDNVFSNCHLDFEINLVQSSILPASDHLINHIIVGGLLIPGQEPVQRKNDLWAGNVGVVLEKDFRTVYSLVFDLRVHYDKESFLQKLGVDLDVDDRTLVNAIFYNKCLDLAKNLMSLEVISIEKKDDLVIEKQSLDKL